MLQGLEDRDNLRMRIRLGNAGDYKGRLRWYLCLRYALGRGSGALFILPPPLPPSARRAAERELRLWPLWEDEGPLAHPMRSESGGGLLEGGGPASLRRPLKMPLSAYRT